MRRTRHTRYTAGIVATALALGTAGPADAMFLNSGRGGSHVPAAPSQTLPQSLPQTPSHVTGGVSDLEYIAIGTGGAVVLIGVGGTLAASRRRQHASAMRY